MNVQAIIYFLKRLRSIYGIRTEYEILIFQNQIVVEIISTASQKYGATIIYILILYYRTEQKTVPTIKDCESQWDTTIVILFGLYITSKHNKVCIYSEDWQSLNTPLYKIVYQYAADKLIEYQSNILCPYSRYLGLSSRQLLFHHIPSH